MRLTMKRKESERGNKKEKQDMEKRKLWKK